MYNKQFQAIMEYVAIFAIVILGLVSVGFISKVKDVFEDHFDECVEKIIK